MNLMQEIARLVMRAGFVQDAVQLPELNAAEYPEGQAHASLADGYARLDRTAEAIASHERGLALDPSQPSVRAKIEALTSRC